MKANKKKPKKVHTELRHEDVDGSDSDILYKIRFGEKCTRSVFLRQTTQAHLSSSLTKIVTLFVELLNLDIQHVLHTY